MSAEFDIFFNWVIPILILIFGVIGNILVIIVFSTKKVKKITSSLAYRSLALADSFFLIMRVTIKLISNFTIDVRILSVIPCKVISYINPAVGPVSAWLIVYISIERFITIKYFNFTLIKKQYFKILTILGIFSYNLILYIPFAIFHGIKIKGNGTNAQILCIFDSIYIGQTLLLIDLLNLSVLPFISMSFLTLLLIYTVLHSRKIAFNRNSAVIAANKGKFKKDVRFAITSIFLNVAFIILNLPFCILNALRSNNPGLSNITLSNYYLNSSIDYVYLMSYGVNFYLLLLSNFIFRNELINLIIKNYSNTNSANKINS